MSRSNSSTDDADSSDSITTENEEDEVDDENITVSSSGTGSQHGSSVGSGAGGSSSDPNGSGGGEGNSSDDEYKQIREYASAETKKVNTWRLIVIASLLVAGAAVSALTYSILSNEVTNDGQQKFIVFSKTIDDAFTFQVYNIFEANRALGRSISTAAATTNQTFPYVKVPAFEARAYEARKAAGLIEIYYAPIVDTIDIEIWLNFSVLNQNWIEESKEIYDMLEPGEDRSYEGVRATIEKQLWGFDSNGNIVPYEPQSTKNASVVTPIFHTSPPPKPDKVEFQNINVFSDPTYKSASLAAVELMDIVFTPMELHSDTAQGLISEVYTRPFSVAAQPVYDNIGLNKKTKNATVAGYIYSIVPWESFLHNLVPKDVQGIYVVLSNSCGQQYTYELQHDAEPVFSGAGSLQDPAYNYSRRTVNLSGNYVDPSRLSTVDGHCQYFLEIYSSTTFENDYDSKVPIIFTIITACLFVLMAGIFTLYDRVVKNRNDKIVGAAARSNAIVSSLFPSNVRARLLADQEEEAKKRSVQKNGTLRGFLTSGTKHGDGDDDDDDIANQMYATKPIADLFPETTVLFADIVGFTAWSSVREPTQVFTLLETIYHAFDEIAKRRRVFKVETVGDCYVAVVGLPEPRHDHAVVMSRFARDCMLRMWTLTKKLETTLGPDTGDLTMRMGLHSGPVTAGVLRGERSRFQLFGDTMNTCARVESNGKKSRIHISEETANLLIKAGKNSWVKPREDAIYAKGKGEMKTFWLDIIDRVEQGSSTSADDAILFDKKASEKGSDVMKSPGSNSELDVLNDKHMRLVSWNLEVIVRLLKQIVARRKASGRKIGQVAPDESLLVPKTGKLVLDEVKEIITLPKFDAKIADKQQSTNEVTLEPGVIDQLTDYITRIAKLYRNNPFHNFEHASHVTMSVVKLLSRIVAPSESDNANIAGADASSLHDHTYGITSDPLTQFSCVLSALIHDLDHPGVPNAQLVKERAPIAEMYCNQSVAEQNSVDIAFRVLMEDKYRDLRRAIYADDAEMKRFRQLVVNSVMATDIVDKELKALRNARWEKAFSEKSAVYTEDDNEQAKINRKATIVIEHLIQASDVAHTMQHWHIYRKWNEHFFFECYQAYKMGRSETDPSVNWYNGEIGFFDFYIIPLAKKLKNCGVFGVSSDEYLNYATKNRAEWERRGQEIVAEMVNRVEKLWQGKEMGVEQAQEPQRLQQ